MLPVTNRASDSTVAQKDNRPIDRHALVTRHNVVLTNADVYSPLSVGNGEFAFTVDITGLQTFDARYGSIPLTTMSNGAFTRCPIRTAIRWKNFP